MNKELNPIAIMTPESRGPITNYNEDLREHHIELADLLSELKELQNTNDELPFWQPYEENPAPYENIRNLIRFFVNEERLHSFSEEYWLNTHKIILSPEIYMTLKADLIRLNNLSEDLSVLADLVEEMDSRLFTTELYIILDAYEDRLKDHEERYSVAFPEVFRCGYFE